VYDPKLLKKLLLLGAYPIEQRCNEWHYNCINVLVGLKDNFHLNISGKSGIGGENRSYLTCLQDRTFMDLHKPYRCEPLAERVENVVSGNIIAPDSEDFVIDSDLGQLIAKFSIC